jgi:hypothetical protein
MTVECDGDSLCAIGGAQKQLRDGDRCHLLSVLNGDGAQVRHHRQVQEIPALPAATILLVEVGSTAHGTGLPGGEDQDERGVVIEQPSEVLGLDERGYESVMERTQPEGSRSGPGDTDRTLHSLRRFVRLAASGNPSILMALWAPVIFSTAEGDELQGLADAFVGRHVIPRYRGYMQSQAERLLGTRSRSGHGRRGGGGREELLAAHGYDTKYAMHCARLGFQGLELITNRRLTLPIAGEPGDWLRAVRRGDVAFDEWWERVLRLDALLGAKLGDDSIPERCDGAMIDAWMVATHLAFWEG